MAPPCYSSPAPLPLPNLAKSPSRLLPTRGTNRHLASPCTRYTSPPSPHPNTHTATQPHSPYRLSRHHQTPPRTPTLRHTHTQPNRVANAQPERHEALHLLGTLIRTVPGPNRQSREISFRGIENSFRDPSPKQEVRGMSRGEVGRQFKSSISPRARHQEPQHPLHSTPNPTRTPAH